MSLKFVKRLIITAILLLCMSMPLMAGEATDRVKIASDKVLAIIADKKFQAPEMKTKREQMIIEAVDSVFNWEEFSKRALAKNWSKRTDSEKKDFITLFGQLVERTYMAKTQQYTGGKISFLDEKIDGEYGNVSTQLVTSAGTQIPVEYRVMKKDSTWWVYDVNIEGVSLVNNYRSQFNDILTKSSYEELVKRLKEKLAKGE
jgi:phospholipid transport system substrate-binding protein